LVEAELEKLQHRISSPQNISRVTKDISSLMVPSMISKLLHSKILPIVVIITKMNSLDTEGMLPRIEETMKRKEFVAVEKGEKEEDEKVREVEEAIIDLGLDLTEEETNLGVEKDLDAKKIKDPVSKKVQNLGEDPGLQKGNIPKVPGVAENLLKLEDLKE